MDLSGLPPVRDPDTQRAFDALALRANSRAHTPQLDSAGTSSLAVTASSSGAAQDTGLTLTTTATGTFMIWASLVSELSFGGVTGISGDLFFELRIDGSVVATISVGGETSRRRAGSSLLWSASIASGKVVKVTAFKTDAVGSPTYTSLGQYSQLMMQQV